MPTALKENSKYLLLVSFLLSVFTFITFNIQNISLGRRVLGAKTQIKTEVKKEKDYWLTFVEENPTYLEGWVELAKIEYEDGNLVKADEYYLKAKEIDPNSEKLPW